MILAGVVVLYNPPNSVYDNIASYSRLLGILFLVDNSEEPNDDLLGKLAALGNTVHVHNGENYGVAWALNVGAERARQAGYAWLLTMDQDSRFAGDDFALYLAEATNHLNGNNPALLTALHNDRESSFIKERLPGYNDLYMDVTSGNIVNLNVHDEVGGYEEKLFIDEVDHDFCLKTIRRGYKIIQLRTVGLQHQLGEVRKVRRRWVVFHNDTRWYYIIRNNLYLWQKFRDSFPELIAQRKRELRKKWWGNLLCARNRPRFVGRCILGYVHFVRGRFGKL